MKLSLLGSSQSSAAVWWEMWSHGSLQKRKSQTTKKKRKKEKARRRRRENKEKPRQSHPPIRAHALLLQRNELGVGFPPVPARLLVREVRVLCDEREQPHAAVL